MDAILGHQETCVAARRNLCSRNRSCSTTWKDYTCRFGDYFGFCLVEHTTYNIFFIAIIIITFFLFTFLLLSLALTYLM